MLMLTSKVQNLMSLENHIFLQISIHEDSLLFLEDFLEHLSLLFQISLFTATVCFERFPCFLVDSLSAVPHFMIPGIRTACFRYFDEDSLPPSDFLEDLLQADPVFLIYLNASILTVCCSRFPWMFTSSPKSFLFPERLTTCSKCSKSESEEVKVAADTFLWTYLYRVPDISINL